MQFSEVIGQQDVKERLLRQVQENRVPHAMLFTGPEGCGKLAMAVAFANYLLCQNPHDGDSCGTCPACRQIAKMGHPDLHFSFPFIKKSTGTTTCENYISDWKQFISNGYYFGLSDWLEAIGSDNKSAIITEAEGDNIIDKLSIASYSGGYKVMIIWLPERMHDAAANNLLKMLEEPAAKTVFILVSNDTTPILSTILSRTQHMEFQRLSADDIARALQDRNGLDRNMAVQVARTAGGSYLNALRYININNESDSYFDEFVNLMRKAYSRDVQGLQQWADDVTKWGRDKQKSFLSYCQNMLRENFIYNFHLPELNYMTDKESDFAKKFSRFINERNIVEFTEAFSRAQRDVEQNVNSKTIFFDFALKTIILIRK